MTFHVDSEVGQLRQAIVHRPGLELSRLSPRNIEELLFDDVMWAKMAKEEHDAFAEALREHGVRVHYFTDLLSETLEIPEARDFVLDRVCTQALLGPVLVSPVRSLLEGLAPDALAEYLVGGVLKADLHPTRASRSLKWSMMAVDDFLLSPLPNHLFTRDNSCWVYGGVSVNPMAKPPGSGRPCTCAPSTATTPCSPTPASSPTTAATTPLTCPPAWKAATCTSWATARS